MASLFGAPCTRRHRIRSVLRTKHVYGLQSGWNVIDEKRWQRRETKQHFTKWHHTSWFVADDCSWPMSHACSKCMMNITCLIVGGLCRPLLDRFAVIISTASRCRWCVVCDLVTARFVRWLCACLSVCLSVYIFGIGIMSRLSWLTPAFDCICIVSRTSKQRSSSPSAWQLASLPQTVILSRPLYIRCRFGARFTKYLTTILRLSYDNAKVTIDLRRTSRRNLQNILQWMESVL